MSSHIKYISFKQNTKNERVVGLHLRKLLDRKLKCKWLDDAGILELVQHKEQDKTVAQMVINTLKDGVSLFAGVE